MAKRIIAVNAGPRKGWNTDALITEASKGAESTGAVAERYDLFRLEKYTGCICSSFFQWLTNISMGCMIV